MPDFPKKDALALARMGRRSREAPGGGPDRPPLGPSEEPSIRDLAVCFLWLSGIALIVASLFV
jgi:hypothetical protein